MFNVPTNHENPPKNSMIFEEYFGRYIKNIQYKSNREYLPIYWTNYYISRNYGKADMSDLQEYLDSLDRSKKYFTIVQWDDGILNNINGLDIFKFASGGIGDYPIPLSSYYFNQMPKKEIKEYGYLCSFAGSIYGRHKVREIMTEVLIEKSSIFITDNRIEYDLYLKLMNNSLFSLCPRGYGKTSFRIYESLMCKSIPVYIYDDPWIPYFDKFEDYGILCDIKDVNNLYNRLCNMNILEISSKLNNGNIIFNKKYSFEAIADNIIYILEKEKMDI